MYLLPQRPKITRIDSAMKISQRFLQQQIRSCCLVVVLANNTYAEPMFSVDTAGMQQKTDVLVQVEHETMLVDQ